MAGKKTTNRGPRQTPRKWYDKDNGEVCQRVLWMEGGKRKFRWRNESGEYRTQNQMELR